MTRIADSLTAEELGSKKAKGRKYTEEDDAYIAENYYKVPLKEMANHLDRTPNSVKIHASYMGITRRRGHNVKAGNGKPLDMVEIPEEAEAEKKPKTLLEAMDQIAGSKMWATAEQIREYERAAVARAHEILGGADA